MAHLTIPMKPKKRRYIETKYTVIDGLTLYSLIVQLFIAVLIHNALSHWALENLISSSLYQLVTIDLIVNLTRKTL